MKMKNTMTKRFACQHNEWDSLAEYLEEQAARGWELTSKTGVSLGFQRCEPRKVKISVELVYPDENEEQRAEFNSFCEAAGWKHIFDDGKIQIFENEDPDAEPIHTDPETKLRLIHRKCLTSRVLLDAIAILIIGGLTAVFAYIFFKADDYTFYMDSEVPMLICMGPIITILVVADVISYFRWYRRASGIAASGGRPEYKRTRLSRISDIACLIYVFGGIWGSMLLDAMYSCNRNLIIFTGVVCTVVILFILLYSFYSAKYTKDRRGDFGTYMFFGILLAICILIFGSVFVNSGGTGEYEKIGGMYVEIEDDELAITLEDLGIETTGYTDRSLHGKGSPLIQMKDGWDSSVNKDGYTLGYCIFTTKSEKLYDLVVKDRFKQYVDEGKIMDASAFDAEKVYYLEEDSNWLLLYPDKIVEIDPDFELSEEQKRIVAEKLV